MAEVIGRVMIDTEQSLSADNRVGCVETID
jgi:hypothetical protein